MQNRSLFSYILPTNGLSDDILTPQPFLRTLLGLLRLGLLAYFTIRAVISLG